MSDVGMIRFANVLSADVELRECVLRKLQRS